MILVVNEFGGWVGAARSQGPYQTLDVLVIVSVLMDMVKKSLCMLAGTKQSTFSSMDHRFDLLQVPNPRLKCLANLLGLNRSPFW